jgi:hypothetical protein
MTPSPEDGHWKIPPLPVVTAAVLLIACAEVGGASMSRFKLDLARWARATILVRPAVHGLVRVRDVDEPIIDEALVKVDAGLRLFHMHAEGMGLVILGTTTVAVTMVRRDTPRRAIVALVTIGGGLYPFGYLLWSALIPFQGIDAARRAAEWLVWMPCGGAAIVAMWWLTAVLIGRMLAGVRPARAPA